MKKSRYRTVLTVCRCTGLVLALILLHGCSGVTKIESTRPVTIMTSETTEIEWTMVTNPNTGEREKRLVRETHTTASQTLTTMETTEAEWMMVTHPDTGESKKRLVRETHTTVSRTSSTEEGEGKHSQSDKKMDYLLIGGYLVTTLLYLASK